MKRVFFIGQKAEEMLDHEQMIERAKKILVGLWGKKYEGTICSCLDSADYIYYDEIARRVQGRTICRLMDRDAGEAMGLELSTQVSDFLDSFLRNFSDDRLESMRFGSLTQDELDALKNFVLLYNKDGKLEDNERLQRAVQKNKSAIIDQIKSCRKKYARYVTVREVFKSNDNVCAMSKKHLRRSILESLTKTICPECKEELASNAGVFDELFGLVNIYNNIGGEGLNLSALPLPLQEKFSDLASEYANCEGLANNYIEYLKNKTIKRVYESDLAEYVAGLAREKNLGLNGDDAGEILEELISSLLADRHTPAAQVQVFGDYQSFHYQIFCTLQNHSSNRTKIHELLHVVGLKLVTQIVDGKVEYALKNGICVDDRGHYFNELLTDYFALEADKQTAALALEPVGPPKDWVDGYVHFLPITNRLFDALQSEFKKAYVEDSIDLVLKRVGTENFYQICDYIDDIYYLSCDEDAKLIDFAIKNYGLSEEEFCSLAPNKSGGLSKEELLQLRDSLASVNYYIDQALEQAFGHEKA